MTTEQEEYDALRETAATGFDLKARLQGLAGREGQITLYLDEEAGLELGTAHDEKNNFGITVGRVQEGVLGEIDKLDTESDTYAADLAKLEAKRNELIAKIQNSAFIVKLRAIPPIVAKGAKRRAKETLKIKGKVPEDQLGDFSDAYLAHLLSDTIVSITDVASGGVQGKLTYEDARALQDYLPQQQFTRLDNKLAEVQFKDAVDESVQGDQDF
jgi:hypothetical protein